MGPQQVLGNILDDFEERLDLDHVERVRERHLAALKGEEIDRPPLVVYAPHEGTKYSPYPVREILDNPAKMMVNELLVGFTSLHHAIDRKDDTPLCIRPNMGTGIVASMFGARIEVVEDNPPWAHKLEDPGRIEELAAEPLPDVRAGLGRYSFEHYEFFNSTLEEYPRCREAFEITFPDLQGPFDTAALLWGSDIYTAVALQPELVDGLLSKISEQMVRVVRAIEPLVRDRLLPYGNFQHATAVKGRLLTRNDSTPLVSAQTYLDVLRRHDDRLSTELDGIAMHFCGNGSHQIENFLDHSQVHCLDFGQAELMDQDWLYATARDRNKPLARLRPTREELVDGSARKRFPCGANLCYHASSQADAMDVCLNYYNGAHA